MIPVEEPVEGKARLTTFLVLLPRATIAEARWNIKATDRHQLENTSSVSKARIGLGCKKKLVRYDALENLILKYCKGLDIGEILPGDDKLQSELASLRNQLQAAEGELGQLERKIDNL